MMENSYDYSSVFFDELRRRNRLPALLFIASGLMILAIVGGSMWLNYQFLAELWQLRLKNILSILENAATIDATRWSYLIAAALFVPIYLVALKAGFSAAFKLIKDGIYTLRQAPYFGNVPADLIAGEGHARTELYDTLKKRALTAYKPLEAHSPDDRKLGKLLTIIFGSKTGLVPPQERCVIMHLARRLKKQFRYLLCIAAVAAFCLWVLRFQKSSYLIELVDHPYWRAVMQLWAGDHTLIWLLVFTVAGLLTVAAIVAVELLAIYLLLPSGKVATERHEDSLVLEGLVHPFTILNRIPGWCDTLRLDGTYNNREYDKHIEFGKDHPVGGAGLFKGAIFIEQQPRYSAGHNRGVFFLLLISGWLLLIAVFALFYLPEAHYVALQKSVHLWETLIGAPIVLPALVFLMRLGTRYSKRFLAAAHDLHNTFHFQSIAVLVELEGYVSGAETQFSRGGGDLQRGSQLVVRGDLTVGLWSAQLYSQSSDVRGPRLITAFEPTALSRKWLDRVKAEIEKLYGQDMRTVSVDSGKRSLFTESGADELLKRIGDRQWRDGGEAAPDGAAHTKQKVKSTGGARDPNATQKDGAEEEE